MKVQCTFCPEVADVPDEFVAETSASMGPEVGEERVVGICNSCSDDVDRMEAFLRIVEGMPQ